MIERLVVLALLLILPTGAQPRLEELVGEEEARLTRSLNLVAFPGHEECVLLSHKVRLLKVNGRVHGLALHQANLHSGRFGWNHYLWDGQGWRKVGQGLPDPRAGDAPLVLPEPDADDIRLHFRDLVRALKLGNWPLEAQERLLDANQIKGIPAR